MKKAEVRARIEEIGIIPGIRVATPEHARFAAEAVNRCGIPIVEVTMTVPDALDVISQLTRGFPEMVVGAGTFWIWKRRAAAWRPGAMFLTTPGLDLEIVKFALGRGVVVFPGALTPTEVTTAWKAGVDFVKVFPCSPTAAPATSGLSRGLSPKSR